MSNMDLGDFVVDGHKIHLTSDQRAIMAEYHDSELFDFDPAIIDEYARECAAENGDLLVCPNGTLVTLEQLAEIERESRYHRQHGLKA